MARITMYANGEMLEKDIQEGSAIRSVIGETGLNIGMAAFRVNGNPATGNTTLRDGDRLQVVPVGGKLAQ